MSITIQSIPFFCLIWIGIGFIFIIAGIFMVASRTASDNHYVELSDNKLGKEHSREIGELFAYFLEEEEKKNQGFRELVLDAVGKKESHHESSDETNDEVNEIIKLYQEGLPAEEIAKKLKKGVGEVNLMISLYTMR